MTRSRQPPAYRLPKKLGLWLLLAILCLATWYLVSLALAPNVVARVLFSETASCTSHERSLVAGVMKNRIGNPAFGHSTTLKAVVLQPGAFSCIGDAANANWRRSRHPEQMTASERKVWNECLACVSNTISPALGPSGRPLVYYHDKSISKPASWDNAKWRAIREVTTEHFIFYSIVPAEPARRWFSPSSAKNPT